MKTPEEIARAQMRAFTVTGGDVEECGAEFIAEQIAEAIRADRAQRGVVEALAEVLEDRAQWFHDDEYPRSTEVRKVLAESLRTNEDTYWGEYIGPMLDQMEKDFKL